MILDRPVFLVCKFNVVSEKRQKGGTLQLNDTCSNVRISSVAYRHVPITKATKAMFRRAVVVPVVIKGRHCPFFLIRCPASCCAEGKRCRRMRYFPDGSRSGIR